MTPLWREKMREAFEFERLQAIPSKSRSAHQAWREMLRHGAVRAHVMGASRVFDMREIDALCWETARELLKAAIREPSSIPRRADAPMPFDREEDAQAYCVDVGERTVVPADVVWLEFNNLAILLSATDLWSNGPARVIEQGVWVMQVMAWYTDAQTGRREPRSLVDRLFLKLSDGHAEVAAIHKLEDERTAIPMAMKALAALAAINSPAARSAPIEPHHGFEKAMRAQGVVQDRRIVHTKVTIGRSGDGAVHDVDGPTYHKAYHFCRAHVRVRRSGKVENVRAHWRGDAAFGVRLPSYTVKPAMIEGDKP